jgi:hypothetical protein
MTANAYAHRVPRDPTAMPASGPNLVVLRPAPSTEPPYDDAIPHRHLRLVGVPAEPLPFDDPAAVEPGPRLFEQTPDYFDPQPTPREELPDPREWLNRLLRVVLECLEGWRPPVQLRRYATPEVVAAVLARCQPPGRPGPAARVRSLHVTEPVDGVVESCAVVQRGRRTHAVAIRLEGLDGRWRCVALSVIDRPAQR